MPEPGLSFCGRLPSPSTSPCWPSNNSVQQKGGNHENQVSWVGKELMWEHEPDLGWHRGSMGATLFSKSLLLLPLFQSSYIPEPKRSQGQNVRLIVQQLDRDTRQALGLNLTSEGPERTLSMRLRPQKTTRTHKQSTCGEPCFLSCCCSLWTSGTGEGPIPGPVLPARGVAGVRGLLTRGPGGEKPPKVRP